MKGPIWHVNVDLGVRLAGAELRQVSCRTDGGGTIELQEHRSSCLRFNEYRYGS
jgi:hypothetical protein